MNLHQMWPFDFVQVLEMLLDRQHLEKHKAPPYATTGVGYEVVSHTEGSGKSSSRRFAMLISCLLPIVEVLTCFVLFLQDCCLVSSER